MGKEYRDVKMNNRLLNANMEDKFKTSFRAIMIGFVVVTVLAMLNIIIYASIAGVGLFSTFSRAVGIILLLAAVVLNIIMLNKISKSLSDAIVVPIGELQEVVGKMKSGDFDVDITYDGQDEIGDLAKDLRDACELMHIVVSDAGYLLGEMADGRFDVTTKAEQYYVGDFQNLILGMRKLNRQLDGMLREIHESSSQVKVGSEQLADSAQELAESATNQASAVEELSVTIDNVTNISEESANNAVLAATSAKNAAEDAMSTREEMNKLIDAMERITETSNEIEKIIVAIEDIASQTNLLSLNASIEAGNYIVERAMEAITTVLTNMESFANMASGAAEASKEQVEMLKQIEDGIGQITIGVQNNSATAQETSAVSEELTAQATGLEEMLDRFVLRK